MAHDSVSRPPPNDVNLQVCNQAQCASTFISTCVFYEAANGMYTLCSQLGTVRPSERVVDEPLELVDASGLYSASRSLSSPPEARESTTYCRGSSCMCSYRKSQKILSR